MVSKIHVEGLDKAVVMARVQDRKILDRKTDSTVSKTAPFNDTFENFLNSNGYLDS